MKRLEIILTHGVLCSRSWFVDKAVEALLIHHIHKVLFTVDTLMASTLIYRALALCEGPAIRLVSLGTILRRPEWGQRAFSLEYRCILFCQIIILGDALCHIKRLLDFARDSDLLPRAIRLFIKLKSTYSVEVSANFLRWKMSFWVVSIH